MHKAHHPERSTFKALLSRWKIPVHPKIVCLKLGLMRNTVLGRSSSWSLRSGMIGEAPAALPHTCRPFYSTAEVLWGWQDWDSESSAASCNREREYAMLSGRHGGRQLLSQHLGLCLKSCHRKPVQLHRRWHSKADASAARTCWYQHHGITIPVQTTWLRSPPVDHRSLRKSIWHPDAVM